MISTAFTTVCWQMPILGSRRPVQTALAIPQRRVVQPEEAWA